MGMKIPSYMNQLGLKNVSVRVNDYVDFISKSGTDNYKESKDSFMQNYGIDEKYSDAANYFSARCHLISFGVKS